ncbi:MAG: hypothetical protein LBN20_06115, partial [Endomicrobium sp.]|nr:hypothetical protein [Endomicrobium sp.]
METAIPPNNQIVSKKRVHDHGEVFTSQKEVSSMIDLVQNEAMRIESRFLEPACGTGNFLSEILKRKLESVKKKYKSNPPDFDFYIVISISSIYGIDILEDNVQECRKRLLKIVSENISLKNADFQPLVETIKFILSKNIVCGDALTYCRVDNNEPIVFSQWSAINSFQIQREDFQFAHLVETSKTAIKFRPVKYSPMYYLKINQEKDKINKKVV